MEGLTEHTLKTEQDMSETDGVLAEVRKERFAQDEKWGEQNHPDVNTSAYNSYREGYRDESLAWKGTNDARVSLGILAWDGILLEEVYEALSEPDPAKLRAELVQVAAVAVNWIEAIDRREGRES